MLHSRADCKASTTTDTSSTSGRDAAPISNSRYQQHPAELQQLQQQYAAAAPAVASSSSHSHPQQQQQPCSHSKQQLRPPPARYASTTSNLACLSRATGSLPQHHKWPGRGGHHHHHAEQEAICTCVLPRTSVLCRLLVVMTVLLVFVQAVSCGMFFCVTLPIITNSRGTTEYQDLSAPGFAVEPQQPPALLQQQPLKAVPKLIPRVIHQTYRNGRLPASTKSFMRTWAEVNGDSWQVRPASSSCRGGGIVFTGCGLCQRTCTRAACSLRTWPALMPAEAQLDN